MAAFFFCAALLAAGCSSTSAATNSEPTATKVAITTQPANQTVPIGRPATFTVAATGSAPINYEWLKNGVPIEGATGASYTTPNITLADSGSTFQVVVSNAANSATSSTATLTAGPRAPAIGDLRYLLWEQVSQPWSGDNYLVTTGIVDGMWSSYANAVGTPLQIGSSGVCYPGAEYDCGWHYEARYLPSGTTGLGMMFTSGSYWNFSSDLQSAAAPNRVILSLDLEPANNAYAFAYVQTEQPGGFDYRLESVSTSDLASTVAADGANSRVVTAVSIDHTSGLVDVISYGWQGDTTTPYETKTTITGSGNVGGAAIMQDVGNAAIALAGEGYFISAFGGNDLDGYILVGMRVKDDNMPRPVSVNVGQNWSPPVNPDSAHYTTVVYLFELGGGVIASEQ